MSIGAPSAAMREAGLADDADDEAVVEPVADDARVLPPSRRRFASMAALMLWPTDLIMGLILHSSLTPITDRFRNP